MRSARANALTSSRLSPARSTLTNRGPVGGLARVLERVLDRAFADVVESGSGLVEEHEARVGDKRPGEGHALLLTAAELSPAWERREK